MTQNELPRQAQEEEDLIWIKNSIGPMSTEQEHAIQAALRQNAPGVLAVCAAIAGDPNVRSPIAVLMHGLREGKHRATPAGKQRRHRISVNAYEHAHAAFTGKYRDLPDTMSDRQRRMRALDYALDVCGAWGDELMAIEVSLRRELDAERRDDDPDWERAARRHRLDGTTPPK